jgi:hypothetical protein
LCFKYAKWTKGFNISNNLWFLYSHDVFVGSQRQVFPQLDSDLLHKLNVHASQCHPSSSKPSLPVPTPFQLLDFTTDIRILYST